MPCAGRRPRPVASTHAPRCARHRLQHGPPAGRRRLPRRRADAGVLLQGAAAAGRAPRRRTAPSPSRASTRSPSSSATRSRLAEDKGCEEIYSFATSAVRDADNCDEVLAHVEKRTGVEIKVLPGEDEARLTFLAVRRWFGWSSGRLAVFDIGGGSLEVAGGDDESPDVAWSLPLGAGPARPRALRGRAARRQGAAQAAQADPHRRSPTTPARCCAAARPTTRSPPRRPSARWPASAGAAPSSEGLFVRRILPADELDDWIPKLLEMDRRRDRRPAGRLRAAGPTRWWPAPWSLRP